VATTVRVILNARVLSTTAWIMVMPGMPVIAPNSSHSRSA